MQSSYKILHKIEPQLRLLRVIDARSFINIETKTKELKLEAVEGRLVECSSDNQKLLCLQSNHLAYNGDYEYNLHQDSVAPTLTAVEGIPDADMRL